MAELIFLIGRVDVSIVIKKERFSCQDIAAPIVCVIGLFLCRCKFQIFGISSRVDWLYNYVSRGRTNIQIPCRRSQLLTHFAAAGMYIENPLWIKLLISYWSTGRSVNRLDPAIMASALCSCRSNIPSATTISLFMSMCCLFTAGQRKINGFSKL